MAEMSVDLYFGPPGLEYALYTGVSGGEVTQVELDCYADAVWAVTWPSMDGPVFVQRSWQLAGETVVSQEYYEQVRQLAIERGDDPEDLPLATQSIGPDGEPFGPLIRMVPPRTR